VLMLPRSVLIWLLLVIWFAGTIPFIVITFWLKDIPPSIRGAGALSVLVAGFSSSFSTAFPFWFVIEWFLQRRKKEETALIQRTFTDKAIWLFSLNAQGFRQHGTVSPRPIVDHFWNTSDDILEQWFLPWKSKLEASVPEDATWGINVLKQFRDDLRTEVKDLVYNRSSFSSEFNKVLNSGMREYEEMFKWINQYPAEERIDIARKYVCYLRNAVVRLENVYRKGHNLPLIESSIIDY